MEHLFSYLLFLAQAITVVIAIIIVIAIVANTASHAKELVQGDHITVKKLNERFDNMRDVLNQKLLTAEEYKAKAKAAAKDKKKAAKQPAATEEPDGRLFVIEFQGDMRASAGEHLREEVTAILTVATPEDKVLVKLESPGGTVHGYGLAASQLQRIRDRGIHLTVAVDKVAASGGYMMACVANEIVAAPFAIIGSIGVVMQLPNLNKLLKKHDIEFEQITAGEYKRTLSMFGENTDEGRNKTKQELEEVHGLFKNFIQQYRPELDLAMVATGEHWHALQAKELGLVDTIQTSDDYLLAASEKQALYSVKHEQKKTIGQKLGMASQQLADRVLYRHLP